jgi:hypothetical protein
VARRFWWGYPSHHLREHADGVLFPTPNASPMGRARCPSVPNKCCGASVGGGDSAFNEGDKKMPRAGTRDLAAPWGQGALPSGAEFLMRLRVLRPPSSQRTCGPCPKMPRLWVGRAVPACRTNAAPIPLAVETAQSEYGRTTRRVPAREILWHRGDAAPYLRGGVSGSGVAAFVSRTPEAGWARASLRRHSAQ